MDANIKALVYTRFIGFWHHFKHRLSDPQFFTRQLKATSYLIFHLLYSAFIGVVAWLMLKSEFSGNSLLIVSGGMAVGSLLSLASYLLILNSLKGRPTAFISGVMISMMMKMFAGLAAIFFVAWKYKELAIPFTVAYLVSYFVFTVPEVLFLNRIARKN